MYRIWIALLIMPLAAASCHTSNEAIQTDVATPAQTTASNAAEEAEVRDLVEDFGRRLQSVSLQAPDAPQEVQEQYAGLVAPTLLEVWMKDVQRAPGRVVSSPWPDRIEISTLAKDGADSFVITGFIVEITSVEVVEGGAAAKIPVSILVQKERGHWLIAEYAETR